MWSVVRSGAQDWPATNAVIDAVRQHAAGERVGPVSGG
jgi:hypothetical protein